MNNKYFTARTIKKIALVAVAFCTAPVSIAQTPPASPVLPASLTPPRPKVEMWFSPNLIADTKNNKPTILDSANIPLWSQTYPGVSVFGTYFVDLDVRYKPSETETKSAANQMVSAIKTDGTYLFGTYFSDT